MQARQQRTNEPDLQAPARRVHRSPDMLDDYVIGLLSTANRPLGAYEVAQRSRQSGNPLAPNQVYRIVERLMARGTVQKIALLSAYVLTASERRGFMVCRSCQAVESFPMDEIAEAVAPLCEKHGFEPAASIVEISGQCRECVGRPRSVARRKIGSGMQLLLAMLATAGTTSLASPTEAETGGEILLLIADPEKRHTSREAGPGNRTDECCGSISDTDRVLREYDDTLHHH